MKKLLLTLTTLFVMAASAFALDVKDVQKKVETFYKSGSYIKTIDTEYGDVCYYYKQYIEYIEIESDLIIIGRNSGKYAEFNENNYDEIHKIYLEDNNLVIEWE